MRLFCAYIVYVNDAIVDTKMAETNGLNDYTLFKRFRAETNATFDYYWYNVHVYDFIWF
jgi:hypothetical protein